LSGPARRTVFFTEVGPRDGFQNWPHPVSTEVKLQLVRDALAAGVPRVEAASMVSPRWVPQMADGTEVLAALRAELGDTAFGRRIRVLVPNMTGYERALQAGSRNVLVNVGATEGFNRHNLNRGVDETLAEVGAISKRAQADGVRVDASISVAWGCPFDGPVGAERVREVAARLVDEGVAELSFGDTIGVATPTGVRNISVMAVAAFPTVEVSMHFHDTRGMALANAMAALETGVTMFEGSIGGIGGCPFAPNATGNVCSEDLVEMIQDLGHVTDIDVDMLISSARRLAAALGSELPGRLQRAGRAPWLVGAAV
jgi:hydroxymethylglutaryl-CoA lyase